MAAETTNTSLDGDRIEQQSSSAFHSHCAVTPEAFPSDAEIETLIQPQPGQVIEDDAVSPAQNPFMALPPELRTWIWEYVLPESSYINSITSSLTKQRRIYHYASLPAITQVSQQIRAETLPFYLAKNTFRLYRPDLRRWSGSESDAGGLRDHLAKTRRVEAVVCKHGVAKCVIDKSTGTAVFKLELNCVDTCVRQKEEFSDKAQKYWENTMKRVGREWFALRDVASFARLFDDVQTPPRRRRR